MKYEQEKDKECLSSRPFEKAVRLGLERHFAIERAVSQAKLCEQRNHFAWAAICWRKANKLNEADTCEYILQRLAENESYQLKAYTPVIMR